MDENILKNKILSVNSRIEKKFNIKRRPNLDYISLIKSPNEFIEENNYKAGDIYYIENVVDHSKSYILILSSSFRCSSLLIAPIIALNSNIKIENTLLIPIAYIPEINKYKYCFLNTNYLQIVTIKNLKSYMDYNKNYLANISKNDAKRILKEIVKKWLTI